MTRNIESVKARINFRQLFAELYPQNYRLNGNSVCPFHHDPTASLQLNSDYGCCHAGCKPPSGRSERWDIFDLYQARHNVDFKTALEALAERAGISPQDRQSAQSVQYDYTDADGTLIFQAVRRPGKRFFQRRPDPKRPGEWINNLDGVKRVLYHLPAVIQAETVYLCEGEKDCHSLENLGFVATTTSGGASNWRKSAQDGAHLALEEKRIVAFPDNDEPGRKYIQAAARDCQGIASSFRIVDLPGLPQKGDVSDFIEKYGPENAKRMLLELAEQAPEWTPDALPAAICNHDSLATVRDALAQIDIESPKGVEFLKMPTGYVFQSDGLFSESEEIFIAPTQLLPTRIFKDIKTGLEDVELAFRKGERWEYFVTQRDTALTLRIITSLANSGYPVSTVNARGILRFHHDFLTANFENMPTELRSSTCGWINDMNAFLCGSEFIGSGDKVEIVPVGPGDQQIVGAIGKGSGTLAAWVDGIKVVRDFPKAAATFYGGFAGPLIAILNTKNPIIDLAGPTSSGKTTVQTIDASAWGKPDDILRNWRFTTNGIERHASLMNDVILVLDDSQLADPRKIQDAIYMLSDGIGKGRATATGMQAHKTWKLPVISSGETPLSSLVNAAGAKARIIQIQGLIFGGTGPDTKKIVDDINETVNSNYGHAGPKFVEYLLAIQSEWPSLRVRLNEIKNFFPGQTNGVIARQAEACAVIALAGELAHKALGFPWLYKNPFLELWDELRGELADVDIAKRALSFVNDWCAEYTRFLFNENGHEDFERPPAYRWYGVKNENRGFVGIFPDILKTALKEKEFPHGAVFREWKDRGWLLTDKDESRFTKKIRLHKQTVNCVCIRTAAIQSVLFDQAEQTNIVPITTAVPAPNPDMKPPMQDNEPPDLHPDCIEPCIFLRFNECPASARVMNPGCTKYIVGMETYIAQKVGTSGTKPL